MIKHRALHNYIMWAKETYLRDEELTFSLYSSLAFDLTVTSIFVPLITGNRIVVYRLAKPGDITLMDVLRDNQSDVLKLTPSHLALLTGEDLRDSQVKRLIVGGEAFDTELARRTLESFGAGLEIYNEYGPTEATVGCTVHKFDPQTDNRGLVPIGLPAANVEMYVLDSALNPVPENVVGEVYISGRCLAEGYLNREQLTAERFLDNPFIADRKMYKTGDVARWLPEGGLEYVGRNDDQVKFHGYRVELNEIRSLLNKHPQVRDSIVLMVQDENDYDVLMAYYVSRQELPAADLRNFLSEFLIGETIPNIFVHLRKIPLTLNGKVSYSALPTLAEAKQQLKESFVAPRTPVEEELALIWSDILGIEQVGINDNFFELGGHSLMVTQVVSRLRTHFDVEVPMRALFEAPTVAGLALLITGMQLELRDGEEVSLLIEKIQHLSEDSLEKILAEEATQHSKGSVYE
jgi:tyrocidine synthetase-3